MNLYYPSPDFQKDIIIIIIRHRNTQKNEILPEEHEKLYPLTVFRGLG